MCGSPPGWRFLSSFISVVFIVAGSLAMVAVPLCLEKQEYGMAGRESRYKN
jgi:hypothetical protein